MKQKAILLITLTIVLSPTALLAQDRAKSHLEAEYQNVDFFIGGAVGYWHDTDLGSNTFALQPEFGYFINDSWAIGIKAGYDYSKLKEQQPDRSFIVSPFVRYFFLYKEPFKLYLDGGLGYNWQKCSEDIITNGYEIGFRPGASIDLTEGICLCLHYGFIGYRKDFFSAHDELSSNGFGLHLNPHEVHLGIEFEF